MKHKWIWIIAALLLLGGGGVAGATGQLGGLLGGSTGTLLIIFLIWHFSKKHA